MRKDLLVINEKFIRYLIPIMIFLLFLFVYMNSIYKDDTVFDNNVNTVFGVDTGDYALATQIPSFGELEADSEDNMSDDRYGRSPGFTIEGRDDFTSKKGLLQKIDRNLIRSNRKINKVHKHLLFQPINHLFYISFKSVCKPFAEEWTVYHERKALVFPSALFGALSVTLLFIFFRRHTKDLILALLFSLLFGFSLSQWFFSGVPETYALQMLFAVLFIFALVEMKSLSWINSVIIGSIIGAAMLIGYNNVLFFIPAGIMFFMKKRRLQGIVCVAVAGVIVVSAYWLVSSNYNEEVGILESTGFVKNHVDFYSDKQYMPWLDKHLFTAENFLFFSIGAPRIDPAKKFNRIYSFFTYNDTVSSTAFFIAYLVFLYMIGRNLVLKILKRNKQVLLVLAVWLFVHLMFFANFNANQAFIYSGLFLVPLIVFYFFSYSETGHKSMIDSARTKQVVLSILVLTLILNNLLFILRYLT